MARLRALELGQRVFERGVGRVRVAAVRVPRSRELQQLGQLLGARHLERAGLVDRHVDRRLGRRGHAAGRADSAGGEAGHDRPSLAGGPVPARRVRLAWWAMDLLRSRAGMIGAAAVLLIAIAGGGWLAFGGTPEATPQPSATPPSPVASTDTLARPSPTPSRRPRPRRSPRRAARSTAWRSTIRIRLERPALAVQIENHPLARPVTNLGRADMVVEATVEGDVTRFTGIYLCRKSKELVGPVRSGRYYSIDLWQDLHVLPFFFGAESRGHRALPRAPTCPTSTASTGPWPYFYRSPQRVAPHNLYADLQLVRNDFGHNPKLDRLAQPRRAPASEPEVQRGREAAQTAGRSTTSSSGPTASGTSAGSGTARCVPGAATMPGAEHIDAGTAPRAQRDERAGAVRARRTSSTPGRIPAATRGATTTWSAGAGPRSTSTARRSRCTGRDRPARDAPSTPTCEAATGSCCRPAWCGGRSCRTTPPSASADPGRKAGA